MSNIIYRTGAELREENKRLNPELFREIGDRVSIKHFFRGEPVCKLIRGYRYLRFLKLIEQGFDTETAYFKAANFKIRNRKKPHV